MLQLRVFGAAPAMADVAERLQEIPGSRHVIRTGDRDGGHAVVMADLVDDAVDRALDQVKRMGVPADDVVLVRLDSIGPSVAQRPLAGVVWADPLSQAGANARPFPRYAPPTNPAARPAGMLGKVNPKVTFVVGVLLSFPGVSYLDALDHIHKLNPETVPTVLLVVGFCLIQQLLLEVPLLGYLFAPERTQDTITRFRAWMCRRGRTAAVIGAGAIGVCLLARGLITFL